MAKYQVQENGVFDNENGIAIPNDIGNIDWIEYQEWLAVPNTPDPMVVFVATWDNEGRYIRDGLLANCDWTQLSDSPLNAPTKALWVTYRQELRDLPATYPDYSTVIWSTPPVA